MNDTSTPLAQTKLPDVAKHSDFYQLPIKEQRSKMGADDPNFAGLSVTDQNDILKLLSGEVNTYRQKRLRTDLGLALIPPLVGYVLLFVIVPWISRGFKNPANGDRMI